MIKCCQKPSKSIEEINNGIFKICANCNTIEEQMFDYLYHERKKPKEICEEWKHMLRDIGGEG